LPIRKASRRKIEGEAGDPLARLLGEREEGRRKVCELRGVCAARKVYANCDTTLEYIEAQQDKKDAPVQLACSEFNLKKPPVIGNAVLLLAGLSKPSIV
jgi:hypothetical protein